MSFQSELLDCYDILKKRTTATTDATHALGSFMKNLNIVHKECLSKYQDFLTKSKKEYLPKMDYSVQSAFSAILDELLIIYGAQAAFMDAVNQQKTEIESTCKERDRRQKELIRSGDQILKNWDAQLELLKKARANYVKAGKDAQSLSENLEKKKQDPKIKPEVVSQLSSKSMAANDKRDNLDNTYKQVLDETNGKMDTYYSQEQPKLLNEYQQFEEERINFMKNQMSTLVNNLVSTHLSSVFESSCEKMSTAVNNIDVDNDISSWATSATKNVYIPNPITYLTYDTEGGITPDLTCGRKPDGAGSSSHGSSSRRAAAPLPSETKSSSHSTHSSSKKKSSSSKRTKKEFDPAKYNIAEKDRNDPKRLQSAVTKMLKKVEEDKKQFEKDLAASQKLREMYANDPEGAADVDEEIASLESYLQQLKDIQSDLEGALESGGKGDENPVDDSNAESFKALYSYDATNDTELSFHEGDTIKVLQKDDSGWWYATIGDQQGFVPENYVEVVQE